MLSLPTKGLCRVHNQVLFLCLQMQSRFFSWDRYFSCICHNTKMVSAAPQPDKTSNCTKCVYFIWDDRIKHSLNDFEHLIQYCKCFMIPSLCCSTFSFLIHVNAQRNPVVSKWWHCVFQITNLCLSVKAIESYSSPTMFWFS